MFSYRMWYLWYWNESYKQKHFDVWLSMLKVIKLKMLLFCLTSSNFQWEPGPKLFSMPQYCTNLAYDFGVLFLTFWYLLSMCIYFQAFLYNNESSKYPILSFTQTKIL